jgi:dTDP-glucose pyrophosphorylase
VSVTKAVILAAGRGTRMQERTAELPKPMIGLAGRPLVAHIVENLRLAGLTDLLMVTGYRAEQVEAHFAGERGIAFRRQQPLDGTARAALLAREFAASEPFLLTYGDILVGPEAYAGIIERLEGAQAVVAVKYVDDPYQGAAVYVEGERVTRIMEKPAKGASATHWNSAGFYCFQPSIFEYLARVPLSPRGEYELTDAIRLLLDAGAPVGHYAIRGWWRDVGRPEDLAEAERHLSGGAPEGQP